MSADKDMDDFYAKIREAEERLFARWVDGYKLTDEGRAALKRLAERLLEAARPHLDNTGGDCRIDLDGHDCCGTCNLAEDALWAFAKYEAP